MTTKTEQKTEETLEQVQLRERLENARKLFGGWSEGDRQISRRVLDELAAAQVDKTQDNFDRKVNRMSNSEFEKWKLDNMKQG